MARCIAEIERYHRTIGEQLDEHDLQNFTLSQGRDCFDHRQVQACAGLLTRRSRLGLGSGLSFLRPVDYYRGDPETLLAERRRRLRTARELRKQENIRLRQRLLSWPVTETITYPTRLSVSR